MNFQTRKWEWDATQFAWNRRLVFFRCFNGAGRRNGLVPRPIRLFILALNILRLIKISFFFSLFIVMTWINVSQVFWPIIILFIWKKKSSRFKNNFLKIFIYFWNHLLADCHDLRKHEHFSGFFQQIRDNLDKFPVQCRTLKKGFVSIF